MIGELVHIDLTGHYGSFVGWVDRIDDQGIAAEGRWLREDGSMFCEQNLNRPWSHVRGVRRVMLGSGK